MAFAIAFAALSMISGAQAAPLRVCIDPDYLPHSNRAGEGFENKIAEAVVKAVFHGYQLYNSYCFRCYGTDVTESSLAPDLKPSAEERIPKHFGNPDHY